MKVIYHIETVKQIIMKSGRVTMVISLDDVVASLKAFTTRMKNGTSNLWVSVQAPETQAKAINTMRPSSANGSLRS